jgi:hypothetical protein
MGKNKETVNQSWSLDLNERIQYFTEFEDGSAQLKLLDQLDQGTKHRNVLYECNFKAGTEDAEMCILAARAKSRITNEVFSIHP